MNRLVTEIVKRVRSAVQSSVASVQGSSVELRTVFHGPPLPFLRPVYDAIVADGGIDVCLPSGERIAFPVLLQVEQLPPGTASAALDESGLFIHESHLVAQRNSTRCPRFVALVPPGRHRNLSISSATDNRGLAADNNSGTATIEDWWRDEFIQDLVDGGLSRTTWSSDGQREQAKRLVEHAVGAADVAARHDASRQHAWCVLSRVLSISDPTIPFGAMLSLACG